MQRIEIAVSSNRLLTISKERQRSVLQLILAMFIYHVTLRRVLATTVAGEKQQV
jgi:hypothetical protein